MSENVEIPSFLVGYQVYQEGRMLILSGPGEARGTAGEAA